jgi:arylsulfatase A-like enzyme
VTRNIAICIDAFAWHRRRGPGQNADMTQTSGPSSRRPEFPGRIARGRAGSEPWWAPNPRPPDGAPNIVIFILDDVGFAQLGCFGSDIDTPNIDALAGGGLRYRNFHTTSLCSPTRSCVMTGRNHHSVGMGRITDLATGFPGYHAHIPRSAGFLPEMLVPHGYAAYALGKWHLTADEDAHLGGPRASWPLGRGFERYYGFLHGETNQFSPALVYDNHRIPPPRSWEDGYHLTEDLADHAIEFVGDLRQVDLEKRFLLYFATGACHSPHQAPKAYIDRYKGHFAEGWDVWRERTSARQIESGLLAPTVELSPRPEWVPAWDSLSADEHRLYERYMECFAGYLTHTDAQIGRVVQYLDDTGELDDTLIFVMSDNGASSEGGPTGSINDARPWNMAERPLEEALEKIDDIGGPWIHNNYPWGWTVAGNTPFRRWKREVHEGGVCDPFVVHWPNGIAARGETRDHYVHAIDLLPTILEAVGIEAPASIGGVDQQPIEGTSFMSHLRDPYAPETRTKQYFEMFGSRALYMDGWKAVTHSEFAQAAKVTEDDRWELYFVVDDPSECHDLAGAEPERLARMIEEWWLEAERYQVLPLDGAPFFEAIERPRPAPPRARYVYFPDTGPVEERAAVNTRNRDHRILAEVEIPEGGAEGVLLSQGTGHGGYVFLVLDGRLVYVHNFVAMEESRVTSDVELTPGRHTLEMCYEHTRKLGGRATLLVDGKESGSVEIPRYTPTQWAITGDGLTCGYSMSLPVIRDYRSPFRFSGTLQRVIVEVDGAPVIDPIAEAGQAMRAQ